MSSAARPKSGTRIELVDALRGSALLAILLMHSIEHFDLLLFPPHPDGWLRTLDNVTRDTVGFLFGGKAYALFALMFGLSFFIILDRAARHGVNYRWRFAWRMIVLGVLGYVHSLLYCGDILSFLAVMGLALVVLESAGKRVLACVSVLSLLQLPFLWQLARYALDPGYTPSTNHFSPYYHTLFSVFGHDGFLAVFRANAVDGQLAKWWWAIDNGRPLQMLGLFTAGLLIGRARVFENPHRYVRFAFVLLGAGVLTFPICQYVFLHLGEGLPEGPALRVMRRLVSSYRDLTQLAVWIGGFVLVYHFTPVRTVLRWLVPYGRMSLTCYVTQSVFWVPMYYHFGFGLYRHLGQFYSLLAGMAFFVPHLLAARGWLKRFHYGPLEWLWRSATRLSLDTPFRKARPVGVTAAEPAPVASP